MFFELLIYPGHYAGCWNLGSDKEIQSLAFDRKKNTKKKQRSRLFGRINFSYFRYTHTNTLMNTLLIL